MTRSQMHRVRFENYSSDCKGLAQGAVAPGYLRQIPGPYVVPMGPAGGPLQGSSLSGPAPAALPVPHFENPLLAATVIAAVATGGIKPPEPPVDSGTTATDRTFPIGPIGLVSVYQEQPSSLTFETDGSGDIQVGDNVTVAATGNSSVNGNYVVETVSGASFTVASNYTLASEIDAQGRVTVTGES